MCLFCKIINKEIPGAIIYEDEDVIAFLDLVQTTKGHTLVLPKKHSENFLEMDNQDYQVLMGKAQMIAKELVSKLEAKGMNVLINTNYVAGQRIFHTHVHLIPRYDENDEIKIEFSDHPNPNLMDLAAQLAIN